MAGQGVADIGEQDHAVTCIQLGAEGRIVMQARQHADIDDVVFQFSQHACGIADANGNIDLRVVPAVGIDHFNGMEWAHGTDLQLAAVELARIAQQVGGFKFQRAQLLCDRQQLAANRGQLDPSPAAVEQLDVVLAFQPLDLCGRRGLAQAQRAGTGTETAMARHGQEGA
ncbi:hypothetical protein D3C86_1174640 [compost metagenome]